MDTERFMNASFGLLDGVNGKKVNVMTAWIDDGGKNRMTSVYVTNKKVAE